MSCLPDQQQQLLLKAVLLEGELGLASWREWQKVTVPQQLDYGSQRLLPLLYDRLRAGAIESPHQTLYKGVYRQAWCKNQTLFHQLKSIIRAFDQAGIKTMLLKGAALVPLYYKNPALRPMADLDLMTAPEQSLRAIEILRTLNWQPGLRAPHSLGFRNEKGDECDLHWNLMLEHCHSGADDDLWQAAITVEIDGLKAYALCPADQLIHVCAHGAWWNPIPPLRWITDAMMILQHANGIDWQRVIEQARQRRLNLALTQALTYLRETFNADIPLDIITRLKGAKVSQLERLDYYAKTQPTHARNPMVAFWVCYREYQQWALTNSRHMQPAGFIRFLQKRWKIDNLSALPLHSLREVMRRF